MAAPDGQFIAPAEDLEQEDVAVGGGFVAPEEDLAQGAEAVVEEDTDSLSERFARSIKNFADSAMDTARVAVGLDPEREVAMTGGVEVPFVDLPGDWPELFPGTLPEVTERLPDKEEDFVGHYMGLAQRRKRRMEGFGQLVQAGTSTAAAVPLAGAGLATGSLPGAAMGLYTSELAGAGAAEAFRQVSRRVLSDQLVAEMKSEATKMGKTLTEADYARMERFFEDPRNMMDVVTDIYAEGAIGTAIGLTPAVGASVAKKAFTSMLSPSDAAKTNLITGGKSVPTLMGEMGTTLPSASMVTGQDTVRGKLVDFLERVSPAGRGRKRTKQLREDAIRIVNRETGGEGVMQNITLVRQAAERASKQKKRIFSDLRDRIYKGEHADVEVGLVSTAQAVGDLTRSPELSTEVGNRVSSRSVDSAELRAAAETAKKEADDFAALERTAASETASIEKELRDAMTALALRVRRETEPRDVRAAEPRPSDVTPQLSVGRQQAEVAARKKNIERIRKQLRAIDDSEKLGNVQSNRRRELLEEKLRDEMALLPDEFDVMQAAETAAAKEARKVGQAAIADMKMPGRYASMSASEIREAVNALEARRAATKGDWDDARAQRMLREANAQNYAETAATSPVAGSRMRLEDAVKLRDDFRSRALGLQPEAPAAERERAAAYAAAARSLDDDILRTLGALPGAAGARWRRANRAYAAAVDADKRLNDIFDSTFVKETIDNLADKGLTARIEMDSAKVEDVLTGKLVSTAQSVSYGLTELKKRVPKDLWPKFRARMMHRIALKTAGDASDPRHFRSLLGHVLTMKNNGTFKALYGDDPAGKQLLALAELHRKSPQLFDDRESWLGKIIGGNIALKTLSGLSGVGAGMGAAGGGVAGAMSGAAQVAGGVTLSAFAFDTLLNSPRVLRLVLDEAKDRQERMLRHYAIEYGRSAREAFKDDLPLSSRARRLINARGAAVATRLYTLAENSNDPELKLAVSELIEELDNQQEQDAQ